MNLLTVDDLTVDFASPAGPVRVVDGIGFSLGKGETLGLVGESGCGKSVTSLSLMRLLPGEASIARGDIRLRDENLLALSESGMRKVRGKRIAMIFQDPMTSLNPVFKIGTQLAEAIRQHSDASRSAARKKAVSLLADVGIPMPERIANVYPHQLSGGMRQRVMIAMALSCDPEVLIADEPTTALDVTIQAQILELMKKLQRERETAILLITHDLGVVAETCDRVCVMYAGKIVEQGEVRAVFREPKHPYTKGLLQSVPQFAEEGKSLYSIEGQVPLPSEYPSGCRFAPRCPFRMDVCEAEGPAASDFGGGHRCACHLYGKEG